MKCIFNDITTNGIIMLRCMYTESK